METDGIQVVKITDLPNEVLTAVFHRISKGDILYNCRLVSRKWHNLATSMCRQRYVLLNSAKFNKKPAEVAHVFGIGQNLPWCAVYIHIFAGYHTSGRHRRFVDTFGYNIQSLYLRGVGLNYKTVLTNLLKVMPNLRKLSVEKKNEQQPPATLLPSSHNLISNVPSINGVQLPMLRKFQFRIQNETTTEDIDFIELVQCACGNRVVSVSLNLFRHLVPDHFARTLQLLLNVEEIALTLVYDGFVNFENWDLPADQNYKSIRKFNVVVSRIQSQFQTFTFEYLERFLNNCGGLRFLSLVFISPIVATSSLQFPVLPKLEALDIICQDTRWTRNGSIQIAGKIGNTLQKISPLHFPCLRRLRLNCRFASTNPIEIFDTLNGTFDCVEEVEADECSVKEKWLELFPNLRKLGIAIKELDELEDIFANMENLRELTLHMSTEMNCNAAMRNAFLSPPGFKDLRRLVLKQSGPNESSNRLLRDSLLLLNQLKPLALEISGSGRLSQECISKLRLHHQSVQINNIIED